MQGKDSLFAGVGVERIFSIPDSDDILKARNSFKNLPSELGESNRF